MKGFWLFLCGVVLSLPGLGQESDTLVYQVNRKLTFADFRGKPDYANHDSGAQIIVAMNVKVKKVGFFSGRAKYDVYAIAFKDSSWVKNAYKDAYTLAHEQLHFDIAHIYAETLELEINNAKVPAGQKTQVEALLRKYSKEMIGYQALYDKETSGGNNKTKQKEWASKIKADLEVFN